MTDNQELIISGFNAGDGAMPWDSQRDVSTALDLKVGPPKVLISLLLHSVRNIGCFTDDALHFDPSIRNIGCITDGVLDLRIDFARVDGLELFCD